ncbi:histidine--tRNA ligase [Sphingomonas gilva]|uniref:Histidine--tRNA ligase n=1 Tax=Sphingomonas gilva TaxID=2305907 RepID=A0A396RPT3_9SPHN|nr:histidine--tRNA ligase [Sphingomonas gilva]RHW16273.1 histidine--tRNA ligase [Sphingomonas gilva]
MANGKTPQRIRGTQDIFGEDQRRFQHVVDTFDRVRRLYAFQRVELPVFEATAVFARSLGETTDVVSKEMYSFEDRGGDSITLRPEFTAGIARAYLTEGWQQHAPLKIATHGPVFRYERPQKGRYRQFHQIDAEIIGAAEPQADVELLALADQLLKELGIADGVTLQLNTLGDAETRDAWREALVAHFEKHRGDLSEDSLARLDKNPLRILDSKDPRDRPIADTAPDIDAHLSSAAGGFFESVTKGLEAAGVAWTRNSRLVRGLDYYRHTAFEFVTDRLGAQGTVLAGGRYDGLIGQLGGPETPGVGWAAGIERLAMLVEEPTEARFDAVVVPMGDAAILRGQAIVTELRRAGVSADMAFRGNMKKRMAKADALNARYAIILGDDEIAKGEATIKALDDGAQASARFELLPWTIFDLVFEDIGYEDRKESKPPLASRMPTKKAGEVYWTR